MDIEQLKIVMDTLTQLGELSLFGLIVYLFVEYVLPFIGWMAALAVTYKITTRIILSIGWNSHLEIWRDSLGIGRPGHLTSTEFSKLAQEIDKLISTRSK